MKKFKKVAIIMACVLMTGAVSAYAYDKYVEAVNFKINLNNREVNLTKEIVTIDGSTYLPLRSLCEEMLGMQVDWNDETDTIDLWNITKPNDRGSHEFPIPKGVPVSGEFKATDKSYVNYDVVVNEIKRGSEVINFLRNEYKLLNPFKPTGDDFDGKQIAAYTKKVDDYIAKLLGGEERELLRATIHIDIKQSPSVFKYNTAVADFKPYCGEVKVNGLTRKFIEYEGIKPDIRAEVAYAGRTILTNGVYEGYMFFSVYKDDKQPRVMYKDGQYLALY